MHVMLQPIATAGNLIGTNLDFARVESPHGAASAGLRLIDDVNAIRGDGSSHWARRAASQTVARQGRGSGGGHIQTLCGRGVRRRIRL